MYIAAGELVAAVSGMSWDDFLEQRLFAPLGMSRSTSRAGVVETRDNVASSHLRADGRVVAVPRRNYDNIGGAGAVFSSVRDMAQWLRLHLNDGEYDGRRLLNARTVAELHTPQTVILSDTVAQRMFPTTHFRNYGLGWILQDYHGRKLVHHSGSINWTRTHVAMIPSEGIGVVAIANLSSSNLQLAVMYRIMDELLGLPQRDWSAEYLELAQRADERSAASARETEAARVSGTRPSLDLDRYAGSYDPAACTARCGWRARTAGWCCTTHRTTRRTSSTGTTTRSARRGAARASAAPSSRSASTRAAGSRPRGSRALATSAASPTRRGRRPHHADGLSPRAAGEKCPHGGSTG
jgi:CubicO group peptidase (beta-lactamase class C family)